MKKESKRIKIIRILILVFTTCIILGACAVCAYLSWENAPADNENNVFSIFISGVDDENYSTDINMLIKMDVSNKKIDIVVIPRDTLLNIDFQIRKLGTVYYGAVKNEFNAYDAVKNQLTNLIGFDVDKYAFIPKSVFSDFISDDKINDITTFFSILNSATDTNATDSNIAYLIRHSVYITDEDVSYYTMPTIDMTIQGYEYDVIILSDWISMLNTHINSSDSTVNAEDLDIVYYNDGVFESTKELQGSWYYDNITVE